MSILTKPLQKTIDVDGITYPIKTDFQYWMRFSRIIERKASNEECAEILLDICEQAITERADGQKLIAELVKFFVGEIKDTKEESKQEKAYDFDIDADLIYSAFYQVYGIDLCKDHLHWHCFKALMASLPETCQWVKIMEFRTCNTAKIKDKEQKKYYRKMKHKYALPLNDSEKEQKMADFANFFI